MDRRHTDRPVWRERKQMHTQSGHVSNHFVQLKDDVISQQGALLEGMYLSLYFTDYCFNISS